MSSHHSSQHPGTKKRFAALPLGLLLLGFAGGCASAAPAPLLPRPVPRLERISGDIGGLLGEEVGPAREDLLGPVTYDLPVESNSWVEAEMNFLLTQRRDVIDRWMERGEYYKGFVQEVFREQGLPTDLYHLGLIESGFIPAARSGAGAVGVWQFMPATGREVGLRVDAQVDERMDPVRSTRAAARHLRGLYRIHGDWTLAAAAYNAGSGRISRGLERFAAVDFWDLAQRGDLAEETRHYVPRLYAMTIIHRNRERLGISSGSQAFAFDSVFVDYATPLDDLAELTGIVPADLSQLNPHLIEGNTPDGGYWVWVPHGTGPSLQRAYLESDLRADQGLASYEVRWGDSLGRISQLSGLSASRIRSLNPSVDFDRLRAGSAIRLPASAARTLDRRPAEADDSSDKGTLVSAVATRRPSVETASYRVKEGDTLSEIARELGVTVAELREVNDLDGQLIIVGQVLRVPGAEKQSGSPPERAATVEYVVRSGDTLSEIAEHHGTSVGAIQRENDLVDTRIRPGQTLSVPL